MEESLESTQSSQEAIAARNKEEAMPPSSVYIGRTTEKRFKGSATVWFLVMGVVLVVAPGIILAATQGRYVTGPLPPQQAAGVPSVRLSVCPSYLPEDWRQIRAAPAA